MINYDVDLFMKYINAAFYTLGSHCTTKHTKDSSTSERMNAIKRYLEDRPCPALKAYGATCTFGSFSILKKGFHASETWKELAPNGMLTLIAERHRAVSLSKSQLQLLA